MADQLEEPYQFDCPLCGHMQQMAARSEEQCRYCGAELVILGDERAANQYAEELRGLGDSVVWMPVPGAAQWVVAHKTTPLGYYADQD
jgi:dihydroxyacetone kinase-like predicted kinase